MGAYRAAVVTAGGQSLIAQALADKKAIEFTSGKTSSYAYPVGTNLIGLTGLQDVEQSVMPFASQVLNDNVAQVSVRFDNNEVTQQYPIQTIGLYARIDEGEELLFSVIQAITPDEMPVRSEVSPSAFIYNIQHTVQNAAQITITVNPAGTATVQDVFEVRQDIAALENPEFDDSGSVEGIGSFPDFLGKVVSKMNIFQFLRDFKAGMQFVLHAGQIVNNCTSTAANLPLAAAQGKVLMDLYTKLNSDHTKLSDNVGRHYTAADATFKAHADKIDRIIIENCTRVRLGFNPAELHIYIDMYYGETNFWRVTFHREGRITYAYYENGVLKTLYFDKQL